MFYSRSPRLSQAGGCEVQTTQALCTCGKCIAGYISPRLKWLLLRYCEIFEAWLPRSFTVFEGIVKNDRTAEADFLDLDVYGDINHMPIALRRALRGDIRVMHGYCEVFSSIIECLKETRAPTSHAIDLRIRYSCDGKREDAKIYLEAGGKSEYVLQYLFDKIKDVVLVGNGFSQSEEGLAFLPRCFNDTGYDMVQKRLFQDM